MHKHTLRVKDGKQQFMCDDVVVLESEHCVLANIYAFCSFCGQSINPVCPRITGKMDFDKNK